MSRQRARPFLMRSVVFAADMCEFPAMQSNGAIVGAGRVGRALHRVAPALPVFKRGDSLIDGLKGLPPSPIYVCTTNDALASIIRQTPAARLQDLVFLQNGMLQPFLRAHGLADNTQALLYLSASADGSCTDGKQTVVCGRWSDSLCALFTAGGLQCRIVTKQEYLPLMVEKLLWSSIFWLLSDALGGLPVGQVATGHRDAVAGLVKELLPVAELYLQALHHRDCQDAVTAGNPAPGMAAPPHAAAAPLAQLDSHAITAALLDYSLSIPAAVPSREMALVEFEWRNGWFLQEQRTPLHVAWLQRTGVLAS